MKFARIHSADLRADNRWLLKSHTRVLPVLLYLMDAADYSTVGSIGFPTVKTTWTEIERETMSTERQVRTALKLLIVHGLIAYESHRRQGVKITLLCWAQKDAKTQTQRDVKGRKETAPAEAAENQAIVRKSACENPPAEDAEGRKDAEKDVNRDVKNRPDGTQNEHPKNLDSTRKNEPPETAEGRAENEEGDVKRDALLKESMNKGVCVGTDTHTPFEPTERDVIETAQSIAAQRGLEIDAAASARDCYLYYAASGWKRSNGARIVNLPAAVRQWLEQDARNGKHKAAAGKGFDVW